MNPSNISLPCTLGDRIKDAMTDVEGVCAGFKVRSDGSKAVCIAWNAHGDPRYTWVSDTRVRAGRTPEQIAADAARAQAQANAVLGRPLSESEAYDARQPEPAAEEQPRPRRRRRANSEGAAEQQARDIEGGQQ